MMFLSWHIKISDLRISMKQKERSSLRNVLSFSANLWSRLSLSIKSLSLDNKVKASC